MTCSTVGTFNQKDIVPRSDMRRVEERFRTSGRVTLVRLVYIQRILTSPASSSYFKLTERVLVMTVAIAGTLRQSILLELASLRTPEAE